ncbi:MAG TPA: DUF255 domain-containing protein, partial [Luteolibacter sp.]|nr:DUF255 domain-containing protein [Luteolibacter sp.]
MKPLPPPALVWPLSVLVLLTLCLPGCRKHRPPERVSIEELKVEVAPELESNQLGALKGAVFEPYAASPIHWQPLHPGIFQQSDAAKRLIFCAIVRPSSPACHSLMRELESDPQTVADINQHYLPVLIDADVASEYALLGVELSDEINRRLAFPVLAWVNSSKHVLASTPVSAGQPGGIIQVFTQSHAMIAPMWKDDLEKWQADGSPGYIIQNSAHDHKRRIEQIASRRAEVRLSGQPREDLPQAIRRLALQYDAYVQNFSTAGAAVPTEAMHLLAEAALCEGLDPSIRAQAKQVVASLSDQLMASPMIDPLDGGVFSCRAGQSWQLPVFIKDCVTQAEVSRALLLAHQATGDPRALEVAKGLLNYAELNCRTEQGLFALGAAEDQQPAKWTWTLEEIRESLGEQDSQWWARATGMEELGNVPIELDASRKLLRKNALALAQGSAETARALSMSPDDFQKRFEAARRKLEQIRSARWRNLHVDRSPHLEASL